MNNFSSVLLLTNDEQSDLAETLLKLGYIPLIRQNMITALRDIQREFVAIIILDLKSTKIDVLEFVINVRDIDQYIPVVIVDEPIEGKEVIINQQNIFFISKAFDQIKKILNMIYRKAF